MTDRPSSQSIGRNVRNALRFVLFGVTGFCVIFVSAICLVVNLSSHPIFGPFTSLLFLGIGAVMLNYGVGALKRWGYITMICSLGGIALILLGVLTISPNYCRVLFRSHMLLKMTDKIEVVAHYPTNERLTTTNVTIAILTNKQDIELFRSQFKPRGKLEFLAHQICSMYFYRGSNCLQSITIYDHCDLAFVCNGFGSAQTAISPSIRNFLNHVGYDPSNFLNAVQSAANDAAIDATTATDVEFIEYLLRENYAKAISNNVPLVIRKELNIDWKAFDFNSTTECSPAMITLADSKDKKLGEAARDFCEKNKKPHTLDSIGRLNIKHVAWSKELSKAIGDEPGDWWEAFYKRYPGSPGIISFSRPGFSKDGTIAIIYMVHSWGGVGAEGRIIVFERKGKKWIETDRFYSVFGGGWAA